MQSVPKCYVPTTSDDFCWAQSESCGYHILAQYQNWFKGLGNFEIQKQTDIDLSGFLYFHVENVGASIKCPMYSS